MTSQALSKDTINQARSDMAAMFRIAAMENLHEGIDNHFSYAFGDGTFLVNRWGVHWSEMKRSDILRIDHDGHVLEGTGTVEATAFFIHEAVHRKCPHAVAILHTHMPYATAISCSNHGFMGRLSQTSLFFFNKIAYEKYNGLANDRKEGDRLAARIGDKEVAFLENHGVMVMAKTMGIAIHGLYFLERASRLQVLAESRGVPLHLIPEDVAEMTANQMAGLDADKETYFEVMKRILDQTQPDYRD